MKKILSIGMIMLMAIISINAQAQDVNEIISKHIEAVGGVENWKKLKSMRTEISMKAQGAEIKVTTNQVHKKGLRVDIEVMGMKGYQILTDKAGWGFMPFAGQTKPEPLTADDVKTSQDQLDLVDEFITYKDYNKKVEFLGKDDVEGTECFKISMTDADGAVTTYFLDASNYFVIKEVSKKKANGKEFEMTTTYSNYKKLDAGIVMAMSQSGDQGDMETTKIEVNPTIDESLFVVKVEEEKK